MANSSVHLHLDSSYKRKEDGLCKFSLRVNIDGSKKLYDIKPEIYMDPDHWITPVDPKTGKKKRKKVISPDAPNFYDLHSKLYGKVEEIKEIIAELEKAPDNAVTHAILDRRWGAKNCETLWEFSLWYLDQRVGELEEGTTRGYKNSIATIREFDDKLKVAQVSYSWICDFQRWMLNEKPKRKGHKANQVIVGYGLGVQSCHRVLEFLGMVLGEAISRKFLTHDPYAEFIRRRKKAKHKRKPINYLEKEDILRLHEIYTSGELLKYTSVAKNGNILMTGVRLNTYLQHILVALYTGLRFSDLQKLNDGCLFYMSKTHLRVVMKKTKKEVKIKITKRLREVLTIQPNGGLFATAPRCNSAMNNNLREIQRVVFGKVIIHKWHELRKSFASFLLQASGDLKAVAELLGHESTAVTERIYAQVNTEQQDRTIDHLDRMEEDDTDLPTSRELLEEMRVILTANPDMPLTAKMRAALVSVYGDMANITSTPPKGPKKKAAPKPGEMKKVA